mgnify:FL=1|jgi:hypothetical protein
MKSVAEIDAEIERLRLAREQALEEEAKKMVFENHREATEIIDRLVADIRRLKELNYLPPRLAQALSDATGKFNPGMYIKRPKPPRPQSNPK